MRNKVETVDGTAYQVGTTEMYITKKGKLYMDKGGIEPKTIKYLKSRVIANYYGLQFNMHQLMLMMFNPDMYNQFLTGDYSILIKDGNRDNLNFDNFMLRGVNMYNRERQGSQSYKRMHLLKQIDLYMLEYENIKAKKREDFKKKIEAKKQGQYYDVFTTPIGTYKLKVNGQIIAESHDRKALIKLGKESISINKTELLKKGNELTNSLQKPKLAAMTPDGWN